jgi:hypothetical protein
LRRSGTDHPRERTLRRTRDANPITYAGLYAAEQQHAAYPDIEPDETTASPQDAYAAAMKVITKRAYRPRATCERKKTASPPLRILSRQRYFANLQPNVWN